MAMAVRPAIPGQTECKNVSFLCFYEIPIMLERQKNFFHDLFPGLKSSRDSGNAVPCQWASHRRFSQHFIYQIIDFWAKRLFRTVFIV
ncbi:MAG: hypothetical protein LBP86_04465 [Azoarcus sp.]|jgi:hypothetical protein|nr:hypothetical protein [Azoarcus sp.]